MSSRLITHSACQGEDDEHAEDEDERPALLEQAAHHALCALCMLGRMTSTPQHAPLLAPRCRPCCSEAAQP